MHALVPFSLFLLALIGFALTAVLARRSSITLNGKSIESLLDSMQPVELGGLSCVAQDYLEPQRRRIAMEPEMIWQLLGGDAGLRRMHGNAKLLLALAAHISDCNDEEGRIVAERMRRDAIRLRSAVRQIRIGLISQAITGHHWISVPFQLQEAASAYYLMRQRLLTLFETSHAGFLPALSQAI